MAKYILFDEAQLHPALRPMSSTRAIADFRLGVDTIHQKWSFFLENTPTILTELYLQDSYQEVEPSPAIYINSSVLPDTDLVQKILELKPNTALYQNQILIAYHATSPQVYGFEVKINPQIVHQYDQPIVSIRQLTDLLVYNGKQLTADFQRLTRTLTTELCNDAFTVMYNKEQIHIGHNVSIKAAILDATHGPIFIDDFAQIEIGALIQGPTYIGKNSIISLGAKIRPNTTIGPSCKIGGEVSKSVIFGYSNKSHDGFMGGSVIGHWCNWGAATNNSNLKNNYTQVSLFNIASKQMVETDQLFVGTIMGDYCKTAIGTLLNTGTVIGVACNLMAHHFLPKYVPSLSWFVGDTYVDYNIEKAIAVIEKTVERRGQKLSQQQKDVLRHISINKLDY